VGGGIIAFFFSKTVGKIMMKYIMNGKHSCGKAVFSTLFELMEYVAWFQG